MSKDGKAKIVVREFRNGGKIVIHEVRFSLNLFVQNSLSLFLFSHCFYVMFLPCFFLFLTFCFLLPTCTISLFRYFSRSPLSSHSWVFFVSLSLISLSLSLLLILLPHLLLVLVGVSLTCTVISLLFLQPTRKSIRLDLKQ